MTLSLQNKFIVIERRRHTNNEPERIVERDRVDNVFVPFQPQQLFASAGFPDFAGAIVAASDESAAVQAPTVSQPANLSPDLLNAQFVSGILCDSVLYS